jgi:hypothetical protein
MEFNISKCKIMHVGCRNPRYTYKMNDQELGKTEEERDIGVTIHQGDPGSMRPAMWALDSSTIVTNKLASLGNRKNSTSFHLPIV